MCLLVRRRAGREWGRFQNLHCRESFLGKLPGVCQNHIVTNSVSQTLISSWHCLMEKTLLSEYAQPTCLNIKWWRTFPESTASWGRLSAKSGLLHLFLIDLLSLKSNANFKAFLSHFCLEIYHQPFVLMSHLLYLVKSAKTSQYWCVPDYNDAIDIWKLKKKKKGTIWTQYAIKCHTAATLAQLLTHFSFQWITSFHKVAQTSHINFRVLLNVSPCRTWVLGATEPMRGCNGLKYKGRGPGDERGDKHRQPHWQALQQETTLWKLEEGL